MRPLALKNAARSVPDGREAGPLLRLRGHGAHEEDHSRDRIVSKSAPQKDLLKSGDLKPQFTSQKKNHFPTTTVNTYIFASLFKTLN